MEGLALFAVIIALIFVYRSMRKRQKLVSWKTELRTSHYPDEWNANMLRFETKDEAIRYGERTKVNWQVVLEFRAVQSEDPINSEFTGWIVTPKKPN